MRKLRRKFLSIMVCISLMAAMLSGCGFDYKLDDDTEATELSEDGQYIVVGVAQVGSESDWRTANTKSYTTTFTEDNGYHLIFEDGQQEQENQVKAVREFILQGVDYIVIDPVVETGWDSVLDEARDAGIPVILADRHISVEDENLYTCFVGSDFTLEGQRAGEWLENYLDDRNMGDDEINIVTLQGTPESSAQLGRTEGFAKVLKHHDNWNMLGAETGDFTQARGYEVMAEFLEQYPDINVVVCENDNMAFGAIEAIEDAGKTVGADGDMIIISFDATKAGLEEVRDGNIAVDFECNPLLGPEIDMIIKKLENGESVGKATYVKEAYFDFTMDMKNIVDKRNY